MRWVFVLLAIVLIFVSIRAINITLTGENIFFTGKPVGYLGLNLTVIAAPVLTLILPLNATYLTNESIPLNYSIDNANSVWYNLDSGTNITINSSIYFNASEGAHTLYIYSNNTVGINTGNVSFSVNSSKFKIIDAQWRGTSKGSSTNFTVLAYEDVQNLSAITLENVNYGKILFNQGINMTADSNFSDNQVDINSTINISNDRISLDSVSLPNFNKSANLWFYGLTFSDPRILRDGVVCPDTICTSKTYAGGTLQFNVTQFSVYSADETPAAPPGPTGNAGGGGGGGGGLFGLFPKATSFSVDVNEIKVTSMPGKVVTKEITVTNNQDKDITISISQKSLDNFLVLKESTITIGPKGSKKVSLDFVVRDSTSPDMYLGKVILSNNQEQTELLTVIEVVSEGALLDVSTQIQPEYKKVSPNNDILAKIGLFNVKETDTRRDIHVEYRIENEDGKQILSEEETVSIETQTSWIKRFTIPKGTDYGKYVLYVKAATLELKVASASDTFDVVAPNTEIIYILVIILILAIASIVIYFGIKNRTGEVSRKIDIRNIINK